MKRIDTATVETDKFGTGRDGFTNGDPGVPTPPTQLDETWFDHVQEELARVVEGNGDTLSDASYEQVHTVVQQASVRAVACDPTASFVLRGLTFDLTGTSLSVTRAAGEVVYEGQRYIIPGTSVHTLTASRDTYFFFQPDGIDALTITATAVANGASAPSAPAGGVLFAMIVSDASDATAVTYYNRGPHLIDENGASVRLRPVLGTDIRAALVPGEDLVDLGASTPESVTDHFRNAYVREMHIRSSAGSLHTAFDNYERTEFSSTSAGGTTHINLLDVADYPDGVAAYVEVRVVGFSPTDPTDGYSARHECHIHADGGAWDLDGSGGAPQFVDGDGAIAASVATNLNISGDDLRLSITGHATDAMRWVLAIRVLITGD